MRNAMRRAVLLALLVTGGAAMAEAPVAVDTVKRNMAAMGYTRITVFEGADGHWEGEGIKHGRLMEFRIDPSSGEVTSEEPTD